MPSIAVIFLSSISLIFSIDAAPEVIKSIAVNGTNLRVNLTTQVGQPYNASVIEKDVHDLWSTGRFDDIRAETARDADGIAVVFKVVENPELRLHEIRIEPSSYSLSLSVPEGDPLTRLRAHEIAREARRQLNSQGYMDARVDWSLVPYAGQQADLRLSVKAGDPVRVKEVEFAGDPELDAKELRGALRGLRIRRVIPKFPGLWEGWQLFPAYSPETVDAEADHLRSWYLSRGYFDVDLHEADTELRRTDAKIRFVVHPGTRYDVRAWTISGTSVEHRAVDADGTPLSEQNLCSALLAERRDAATQGIIDFSVRLNVQRTDDSPAPSPVATLTADVDRGRPYRIKRIDFAGNRHYKDAFVRRNLLLDENDLLDPLLLRKSIARLNRAAAFEPITDANIAIRTDEKSGKAAIMLRLFERKHRSWRLSGPVGPASVGGPLAASLSSRLPAWGSGLFELSTYAASFSLTGFAHPILPVLSVVTKRPISPVLALERPFSPGEGWKSGMVAAPQLGWRFSAGRYVTTQLQQRLIPLLAGDHGLIPNLPITVERPQGEMTMVCESPKPRFTTLRTSAAVGLQFMGEVLGF